MKKLYESINGIYQSAKLLLLRESGELNFLGKAIKIAIIIFVVKLLLKLANTAIEKTLRKRQKSLSDADGRKVETLSAVLKSVIKYLLYFIAIVNILDIFNVKTSSILATAGIGGLAIGFGAQSLVKDVITGFFILLEDQFSVGDHIQIGSYEGIVEELGVRVTKIRDFSGELHIIPNSNITTVTNKARGAMRARVVVTVAYEEDIDETLRILDRVCEDIAKTNPNVVEGPEVVGISDLNKTGMDIMIVGKALAMEQWGVERQIRKEVKEALEDANIEIPYPRLVIKENEGK